VVRALCGAGLAQEAAEQAVLMQPAQRPGGGVVAHVPVAGEERGGPLLQVAEAEQILQHELAGVVALECREDFGDAAGWGPG
jgi:hypothetical protein